MRQNLGDILLDAGKITLEQLEFALRQQTEAIGSKRRLGRILVEHHFIAEEVLARTLANQLGLAYVDLGSTGLDGSLKDLLPRRVAEKYQVIPLERVDGFLHIAMADPTDVVALDDIRIHSGLDVLPFVALPTDLKEAMDRLYSFDSAAMDVLADLGGTIDVQFVESQVDIEDIGVLQRATETAPIVTLCNSVLAMAVRERCTDIHIEPKSSGIHIRFRVDGLLREIMKLPKTVQPLFISRIKIMSGIDIAERRRPQDGNISLQIDNQSVDCRVSTLPTPIGEKIVIRLLKKGETRINLDSLGMHDDQLKVVYRYLDMPQGLVVFTGPTGAGKTTAMYAALTYIRSPEKNIVTLEDPIEYQMQDLTQVQIDEKIGLTFPRGLRTILRQDPDVVMVGEIRDSETAQIVIQAALTGHLVLSSLHTNDAVS
ncbi:MAG: ATPase, T2SS/T4P/T4SS family, partial [Actinomycetota bacterium]